MPEARTVGGANTPPSAASVPVTAPVVPQRSTRRATARRASSRRATARERKGDVEGRVIEYLQDHPHSTIGDMAKGLNSDRATIAAEVNDLIRASEATKDSTGLAAT